MSVLVWAERETQNFASLLGRYAVIDSGLLNECIGMGRTGDARFCVSQGVYAVVVSGLLHEYVGIDRTGDARFYVSTGLAPLMEMGNMYAIESLLWCVSMCG